MALLRRLHLTPSLKKKKKKKKIQQHETSFRFGSSCQRCNPYSLHYGTSNMIQLTTSVELTSWPTRISAKKNLWKLEFQCKGQEAKNSFLFFSSADMQWAANYIKNAERYVICFLFLTFIYAQIFFLYKRLL